MKLGVIADDFTGASDIALTLAEAGMSVTQFIGVPDGPCDPHLGAGVVALKSRTAPVSEAVRESLAACDWLLAQGATQIVLKVCSTFDSTAEGNIGPVLQALAERTGAKHVLTCPAFPENGRSVYQGHLFVQDALLNESGMQDHPLTPMKDPDLRRVLASQTHWPVAHVPTQVVREGAAQIRAALPGTRAMVIVDAIHNDDLLSIGQAAKNAPLLCGGSGIALGLPANFGLTAHTPSWYPVEGKGIVLSGSCSRATRRQVAVFKQSNPSFEVSVEALLNGALTASGLADWAIAQDRVPLIYSSADPEIVRRAQQEHGTHIAAARIEALFADLAAELADRGVTRIVVAGGETSGAVVKGLGTRALKIGPRIAAGVPLVLDSNRALALALKSGNFGDEDFFATALEQMGARR